MRYTQRTALLLTSVMVSVGWSNVVPGSAQAPENTAPTPAIAQPGPPKLAPNLSPAPVPEANNQDGFIPVRMPQSKNPSGTRQIVGRDDRAAVMSRAYPWSAIGRLEHLDQTGEVVNFCTGTLIGKDLVLTNAHCVIERSTGQLTHFTLRFRPNLINDSARASAYVQQVRYGETGQPRFGHNDWALLKLDRDLGSQFGTLGWRSLPTTELQQLGAVMKLIGYSGDFPKVQPGRTAGVHQGCQVLGETIGFLSHNCDTNGGASGGPIVAWIDGQFRIVGLHAGTLGAENRAIKVSQWAPAARRLMN